MIDQVSPKYVSSSPKSTNSLVPVNLLSSTFSKSLKVASSAPKFISSTPKLLTPTPKLLTSIPKVSIATALESSGNRGEVDSENDEDDEDDADDDYDDDNDSLNRDSSSRLSRVDKLSASTKGISKRFSLSPHRLMTSLSRRASLSPLRQKGSNTSASLHINKTDNHPPTPIIEKQSIEGISRSFAGFLTTASVYAGFQDIEDEEREIGSIL